MNFEENAQAVRRNGKKNSIGHTTFGEIEIEEVIFYDKKQEQRFRPFSPLAGVSCRGYSLPLQRVISDFGADHPFHKINKKFKEHYGIEVATGSARKQGY